MLNIFTYLYILTFSVTVAFNYTYSFCTEESHQFFHMCKASEYYVVTVLYNNNYVLPDDQVQTSKTHRSLIS